MSDVRFVWEASLLDRDELNRQPLIIERNHGGRFLNLDIIIRNAERVPNDRVQHAVVAILVDFEFDISVHTAFRAVPLVLLDPPIIFAWIFDDRFFNNDASTQIWIASAVFNSSDPPAGFFSVRTAVVETLTCFLFTELVLWVAPFALKRLPLALGQRGVSLAADCRVTVVAGTVVGGVVGGVVVLVAIARSDSKEDDEEERRSKKSGKKRFAELHGELSLLLYCVLGRKERFSEWQQSFAATAIGGVMETSHQVSLWQHRQQL